MRTRLIALLGLPLVAALSILDCRQSMTENWQGGFVTKPGIYKLSEPKLTLTVWVDADHLVRYSLSDSTGKCLVKSTARPSAYQKWYLYLDSEQWLWFESSDIGSSVSKKNEDGSYQEISLRDQPELIQAMPSQFFLRLPKSVQGRWGAVRSARKGESEPH